MNHTDLTRRLTSVIVPVYDEGENIQTCLRTLRAALCDHPHEILVCYDSDEDTTLPAIEAMPDRPESIRLVRNDIAPGVVHAIRAGIDAAHGDVVVTFMADLSDEPEIIPIMAEKIRAGAAVVAGSRYMRGGGQIGGPRLKCALSRLAGLSLHHLAGVNTHDATTNFRAYSADFLRQVRIESKRGFEIALELTAKAHRMGLEIDETPSVWRDRTAGQSHFRLWNWLPAYLRWYWHALSPSATRALLWLVLLISMMVTYVTWCPPQFSQNLDPSWQAVIHKAFDEGWQFGPDITFTFGPYGFLWADVYYPSTYAIMLALQSLTVVAITLVLGKLLLTRLHSAWAVLLWIAAVCFFATKISFLLPLVLVVGYFYDSPRRRWDLWLLAAVMGIWALAKFNTCLVYCGTATVLAVADLVGRRRMPLCSGVFLSSLVLAWVLAGQNLSGIGTFITRSIEISRGYGQAMCLEGPFVDQVPFLLTAGLAMFAVAVIRPPGRRAESIMCLLGLLGILFINYKTNFTRQHASRIITAMAFTNQVALVLFPVLLYRATRFREKLLALILLALVAAVVIVPPPTGCSWWQHLTERAVRTRNNLSQISDLLCARSKLADEYAHGLAEMRMRVPFPEPDGTVDIYSYQQAFAIAHDWQYSPRPVFQSYSACSAPLLQWNADHLRGSRAPNTVFFALQPIDCRFPPQQDSLSWPELLTRYELCGENGPFLHLRQAANPGSYQLEPIGTRQGRLGENIQLPDNTQQLLWASIDLTPTSFGQVAELAFKNKPVYIWTNESGSCRLIPAIARAGILVSPRVSDTHDFARLFTDHPGLPVPRTIRIDAHPRYWQSTYTMHLFRLNLARPSLTADPPAIIQRDLGLFTRS